MSDSYDPMDCSPQATLSMRFSRQEYWSGLPFPSPGDLPNPGIKPGSPILWADSLPSEPLGKLVEVSLVAQPVKNLYHRKMKTEIPGNRVICQGQAASEGWGREAIRVVRCPSPGFSPPEKRHILLR